MENLFPRICIDIHDWKNRTRTKKLLLNLFKTNTNNKQHIKENLQDIKKPKHSIWR